MDAKKIIQAEQDRRGSRHLTLKRSLAARNLLIAYNLLDIINSCESLCHKNLHEDGL
jgi:hypothetical protein